MSNAEQDVMNIRRLPWSVDAEQSVLGGLLLDPKSVELMGAISEADFYREDHRLIFRSILSMIEERIVPDVLTCSNFLRDHGLLDQAGGLEYLGTIAKDTPSAANIAAYASIVRKAALRRKLIAEAESIVNRAFDDSETDVKDLINELEQGVYALSEQVVTGRESMQPLNDVLKVTLADMDAASKRSGDDCLLGNSTGSDDLNELISGLEGGSLYIVAGRPSMGKTTFAMNMAEDVAIKQGKPAIVFSMEMPANQLAQRLMASQGRIPLNEIRRTWTMSEDSWPKVAHSVKLMRDKPMFIDDTPGLSIADIRSRCRQLRRRIEREYPEGLGVIVIDYLQLMSAGSAGRGSNRAEELGEISRQLKTLAKEMDVPVVALSQLNRSLEQRPNKRPIMSDLRESGAIEQDADVIMFVYRDEVYKPDSEDKGTAEIIIGKQRNGPLDTVRMTANLQFSRFDDYSPAVFGSEGFQ